MKIRTIKKGCIFKNNVNVATSLIYFFFHIHNKSVYLEILKRSIENYGTDAIHETFKLKHK